ncbi:transcription antitermination factor NusB [Thermocrinis sp.]|uniref:transcription antitermination factor NusB n=1 Tax=Thermocrinis sp. TaxID=2024383 RepID=UPI002FDD4C2C
MTIYKTKAREDAFLVLYQWDIKGGNLEEIIEEYIAMNRIKHEERRRYLRKLLRTYFNHAEAIDKQITDNLEGWDFDRLGYIERNILRLALAELLYIKVKYPVLVLYDYLRIATKYAGKTPAKFINGVISKINPLSIPYNPKDNA